MLDMQLIIVIGLYCIACPDEYLLAKWLFLYDQDMLIASEHILVAKWLFLHCK